jgi:hypothetical protein
VQHREQTFALLRRQDLVALGVLGDRFPHDETLRLAAPRSDTTQRLHRFLVQREGQLRHTTCNTTILLYYGLGWLAAAGSQVLSNH